MSVEFAGIWQSYAYTYCAKTGLKKCDLRELSLKQISKLLPGWVYEIS